MCCNMKDKTSEPKPTLTDLSNQSPQPEFIQIPDKKNQVKFMGVAGYIIP